MKMTRANINAYRSDMYSLAPKYAEDLNPNAGRSLPMMPESTNAASAFIPIILKGRKGFSTPFMSMTNIRNANVNIAHPPA